MEPHENSIMLNPREVAEILGIHQKTVHLWLRTGKLEGVKISYRSWRIPKAALNEFIEMNRNICKTSQDAENMLLTTDNTVPDIKSPKIHKLPGKEQPNPSQKNMKHYIRDIMGEQSETNCDEKTIEDLTFNQQITKLSKK
jgi:excisionase family DNA binding protein